VHAIFATDESFAILISKNQVLCTSDDQATASLSDDDGANHSTGPKITEGLNKVWREGEAASN